MIFFQIEKDGEKVGFGKKNSDETAQNTALRKFYSFNFCPKFREDFWIKRALEVHWEQYREFCRRVMLKSWEAQ